MKKIIISLTLSAALLSSTFMFAADIEPNGKVIRAFSDVFKKAKDVEWTTFSKDGVYQARFNFNNESLQAFFTEDGDYIGTTRQVTAAQLPIIVAAGLEKQYSDARIVSIFEYSRKDGLDYFITLSNSKGAMIVKATGSGDLSVYRKNIK